VRCAALGTVLRRTYEERTASSTLGGFNDSHGFIVAGAAGFSVATHVNVDAVRKEGA
jgi:hypothetical protein